ncbi:lipid-A-disaccharide synthase [Albibacterium bauzanense]|uniref:Lipid-A-disaccharide synthase n=1 Tax=Albibacterium bauzanense TaxID=653929 RepID=A0A4R1M286_9SPHI|nr:lipid-A-disaccharide synthase [Albibacterium bauzanense]TCK85815.1 lipid-A-disaccharide synthase [Albibacterium bauzanense]
MKYYLIAGETSGDLHGANLIRALKSVDPQAHFRFIGGDAMERESGEKAVIHSSAMSFMGFIEVLANLFTILGNLKKVKKDLLANRPDAIILIDFPGFNLKIADFAKKNNIKTFYYISPKVWAWNQKRVLKIKHIVDHLFCILPFEVDFYKEWGMEVDYVGNPLLDAIGRYSLNPDFRNQAQLNEKPIIALLPGSRKMEITKLLPLMANLPKSFPAYQFVVAGAPGFSDSFYQSFFHQQQIPVVFNQTYDLLNNAKAAIVASGTATLETALFHVPQIVVYKANILSIWIAKLVIKVKYISLVNLIMHVPVVRELIQADYNEDMVKEELNRILYDDAYRSNMLQNYKALDHKMGEIGASERTAKLIQHYLKA